MAALRVSVALGAALAALAHGAEEVAKPDMHAILKTAMKDVMRQASDAQATISRQVLDVQRRLGAGAFAGLKAGRRLAPGPKCAWADGGCDVSPSYLQAQAAGLPQGSFFGTMLQQYQTCNGLDDMTCKGKPTCLWDMDISQCTVGPDTLGQALFQRIFDPATCGDSGIARMTAVNANCSMTRPADCGKNPFCKPSTGMAPTSMNSCVQKDTCAAKSQDLQSMDLQSMDFGPMCPPTFNATQAGMICTMAIVGMNVSKLQDPAVAMQVANCTLQGCPVMQRVMMAQLEALATCAPLMNMTACMATSNCLWDGHFCRGQVDGNQMMSLMMQDVPDTCNLKGFMQGMGTCSGMMTEATCTGSCLWQPMPSCDMGHFMAPMACQPSPGLMMQNMGIAAGGPEADAFNNASQVSLACGKMANKTACQPAPTESASGATGTFRSELLAAPLFLSAVALVLTGL